MIKLSIIVPVYNVEKYIEECLNSLVQQNFSDEEYEIICVDDGSTDRSGEIAEDYGKRYRQIKVLRQAHKGVSMARNEGVKAAKGEYVCFVDSDDYLSSGVLGTLYDLAVKYDLEKLMYGYVRFEDGETIDEKKKKDKIDGEESIIFFQDALEMRNSDLTPDWQVVWNYLIRHSIIKEYKLQFIDGVSYYEDDEFNFWLNHCVAACGYIDKEFYHYRQYKTSSIHSFMNDNKFSHYIHGRCKVAIYHRKVLEELAAGNSLTLKFPVTENELEMMLHLETRKILSNIIYKGNWSIFKDTLKLLKKEQLYPYPIRLYRMGIDKRFIRFLFDCFTVLYPIEWYLQICMLLRRMLFKKIIPYMICFVA